MMVKGLALIAGAAMTFFARSSEWTRAHKDAAEATPFAGGSQHYFAFLSYSHQDQPLADWLEDQLEKFRVPRHLVGRITDYGAVPRKLTPIFRDLKELPASDDLGTEIKADFAGLAERIASIIARPAMRVDSRINAISRGLLMNRSASTSGSRSLTSSAGAAPRTFSMKSASRGFPPSQGSSADAAHRSRGSLADAPPRTSGRNGM